MPLAPLVFAAPARPASSSTCLTSCSAHHGKGETLLSFDIGRRIEVEDQVGLVDRVVLGHQARVVLDGALVGEPDQSAPIVGQRVLDVPLGPVGPDGDRLHPFGRVLRQVLLHERFLPGPDPDHRERSVAKVRDHPIGHLIDVVHQVALGRIGPVEQGLVEMGQLDAVAGFLGLHLWNATGSDGRRPRSAARGIIGAMESFEFEAELWVWDARRLDTWTFVSLPAELSQEVFERRTGTSAGRLRVGAGRRDHRYDLMADVDLPGGGRSIRPAGQEGGAASRRARSWRHGASPDRVDRSLTVRPLG